MRLHPRDELRLGPDPNVLRRWRFERGDEEVGALRLRGDGRVDVPIGDRELAVDAVDRRTLALWEPSSREALAWHRRTRRPWVAAVSLPDTDDLRVRRGFRRPPRLCSADGALLASFETAVVDDDQDAPEVHVTVADDAAPSPGLDAAVLLVTIVVLLDELGVIPSENRAASDVGWARRDGLWDGLFGGGDSGGGGGGGGGDGG